VLAALAPVCHPQPAGSPAGKQIFDAIDHHLRLERFDEHAVASGGARDVSSIGSNAPVNNKTGMLASWGLLLINSATS
jgi:hypothetical protein